MKSLRRVFDLLRAMICHYPISAKRRINRIVAVMICLKLPPPLRGRAGVGGFKSDIAGFRRLEIPVKGCRISKSDLLCCNGCKMLKQVQHDK